MFWALPWIFGTYSRPIRRGLGHYGPNPLDFYRFAPRATLSPLPYIKDEEEREKRFEMKMF